MAIKEKKVSRVCKSCKKVFYVYKSDIKRGKPAKYCSKSCYSKSQNKEVKKHCKFCKKSFLVKLSEHKRGGGVYCSQKCYNKARIGKYTKEKNPNWKGGFTYTPYCNLFNNDFKERCREFWNRECVISGITEKENKTKWNERLAVHHVNYDKETCCNKTKPLFVAVSKEWHSKLNFNRKYWEELLTNYIMIWYDGNCYLEKN